MGGRIALGIAVRVPERVASLTLISAAIGLPTPEARANRIQADADLAAEILTTPLPEFLRRWYALPIFANLADDPQRLEGLVRARSQNNPEALAHCLQIAGTGNMPDLAPALRTSQIPLTYLYGDRDHKFAEIAKTIASLRPDAVVQAIADAGHALLTEAPAAVANSICQRLNH